MHAVAAWLAEARAPGWWRWGAFADHRSEANCPNSSLPWFLAAGAAARYCTMRVLLLQLAGAGCCLSVPSTASAPSPPSGRVSIDFGHGWRYHVGDDPSAGISGGIGAFDLLTGFSNMTSCHPMVEKQLYHPGGHKSDGQLWTDCAVACSYDERCTAYVDHRLAPGQHCPGGICCRHGNASTKCTHDPAEQPRLNAQGHCPPECPTSCRKCCVQHKGCCCDGPSPDRPFGPARLKTAQLYRKFAFAKEQFDDTGAGWRNTSLPHDALINQTFAEVHGEGSAFLPRTVMWYRKNFAIPATWRGKHIFLYFQGAFQFAEVYLNGASIADHETGYTTWTVRMDNVTSLRYGGASNTLAVRVDPSFCSGHWYEGGGINRPISIVASPKLHFVQGGESPAPT
jgi:hypothetical protein